MPQQCQQQSSSDFVVKNKKSVNYKCNKLERYQSECKNSKSEENGNNNKCFFCGTLGH